VAGKEAQQAARAGLDTVLGQPVAQLVQEDLRLCLVGGQDQVRMGFDGLRGMVAA
jgi:hypothetical protein